MKKLGDALRMISSVLLGIVIRDSDELTTALNCHFFAPGVEHTRAASLAASLAPLLLTALFVRNIHGSAQYDALVERRGYVLSFERSALGRFATFAMALGGLFAGPFLADHLLAHHANDLSELLILVVLFCPILVYTAWDVSLWLAAMESKLDRESGIHEIAWRWLVVDACAWTVVLGLIASGLKARSVGVRIPTDLSTLCFVVVATGTIFADYVWNAHFYFPANEPPSAEPTTSIGDVNRA